MKLAQQVIQAVNEVLNVNNLSFQERSVTDKTEMDGYYVFDQVRPRGTRLVVPHKDNKYRPIEVQANVFVSSSQIPVFGHNVAINYFTGGYYEDELNSRFGGRVKIKIKKDHGWMTAEKFYLWMIKEGMPNSAIVRILPQFKDMEVKDDSVVIKHKEVSFIGFEEKKHGPLIDIFDKAEQALSKVGFDDLMYGKVYLVPKTTRGKQTTLADYIQADDSMRVFDIAQKTKSNEPVRTVIHELGHRLYRKRLSAAAYRQISDRYAKALSETRKKLSGTEGATPAYVQGQRFKTIDHGELEYGIRPPSVFSNRGKTKPHILWVVKDGVKSDRGYTFSSLVDLHVFLTKHDSNQTDKNSERSTDPWLPTTYSTSKDTEWFAEIFSFAVLEKNKEILDWIKGLK